MKNYNKMNKLMPLRLQLFAEGEPGDGETPKTFTENEVLEREKKLKARIDELSKVEKEFKQFKDGQLSEEEKRAKELQEKDNLIEQYRSQIEDSQIKDELLQNSTFTVEEANKIIQAKGNRVDLAKLLNQLFADKLSEAKKTWEKNLSDSSSGVSGGGAGGAESLAQKKAKSLSKQEETKVQWGNFNN